MIVKIFSFILSILLIPACAAFTISFYRGVTGISGISGSGLIFILGAFSYSVLHLILFKLDFLYVLGHEVMHAIATFVSGGKVLGMKVSGKEGSVKTTTPNLFIMLAPYLVPVYVVMLALLYFVFSFFTDAARFSGYFIFFTGFTLMFHLVYTAESIREKQSDLMKAGYFFSISLIYIVNIVIVYLIISFLFPKILFFDFISASFEKSKQFYYSFWRQLFL
ncbi:MAG: hypothetical protein KKB46_00400 [Candidatus Omnitrophica bacterium]|nr:hypothetical protein [Candidatus Omnitrophota bacterium]